MNERAVRVVADADEGRGAAVLCLAGERPTRDRDHAHRVVVARAKCRRRAMARKVGDEPVRRSGGTPPAAGIRVAEVVQQHDGHASTSVTKEWTARNVASGSSRWT